MIKSISHWSTTGGLDGSATIEAALDEAKSAGFKGIELAIGPTGPFSVETDRPTAERYRKEAEKRGLVTETVATGITWGVSPNHPDKATREKSVALHTAAIERAAWFGAKAMLMVPGAIKIPWEPSYGPVKYDDAVNWSREAVKRVAAKAEQVGVDLCVENVWNGMFYSPLEYAAFIDSIGSPRVGSYFDVGNLLGYHQYPPHWIELLGKRIRRVHIKDFKTSVGTLAGFCDLLEGDVPWQETMAALRQIGYDETIVAEMLPPAPGLLERTSRAMDRILTM